MRDIRASIEVQALIGADKLRLQRVPGMTRTRLSRRLGLDGNPLRRRTDKIAARAVALLLAAFLIGAPLLSVAVLTPRQRGGHGNR